MTAPDRPSDRLIIELIPLENGWRAEGGSLGAAEGSTLLLALETLVAGLRTDVEETVDRFLQEKLGRGRADG